MMKIPPSSVIPIPALQFVSSCSLATVCGFYHKWDFNNDPMTPSWKKKKVLQYSSLLWSGFMALLHVSMWNYIRKLKQAKIYDAKAKTQWQEEGKHGQQVLPWEGVTLLVP